MAKMYGYNTAATQIKKRYAHNGTTAVQVKKRYAHNGTTAKLVYSAGYSLIENFSSYTAYNYDLTNPPLSGWGLEKSGANLVYSCGAGKQAVILKPKIDVTNYKKITMVVSARTLSTSKGVMFGLVSGSSTANFSNTPTTQFVKMYNTGTYTIDLSNVTGSWYINSYPIEDRSDTGTITFSEFTFEE